MPLDPTVVLDDIEKHLAKTDARVAVAALRVRLHLDQSLADRIVREWLRQSGAA